MYVYHTPEMALPDGPLVKGCIANIGIPSLFSYFYFDDFLRFSTFSGFWCQPTVDQPTVSQPTVDNGGESVAVAVGVSDRWRATGETRHVTNDM